MTAAYISAVDFGAPEEGVLVCDQVETPGDAPASCARCGGDVRVMAHQVELFAREPVPEIRCRKCQQVVWDERRVKKWDDPIADIMRFTEKISKMDHTYKLATNTMHAQLQTFQKLQESYEIGLQTFCVECCAPVKGKSSKRCRKCQLRHWRRFGR